MRVSLEEGPTVRRRRVGEADGERAEAGDTIRPRAATEAEELAASLFRSLNDPVKPALTEASKYLLVQRTLLLAVITRCMNIF